MLLVGAGCLWSLIIFSEKLLFGKLTSSQGIWNSCKNRKFLIIMRKKKIFSPHFFFHLLTWLLIFPWSNNLNFCNSQLAKTLSDWIAFLFTSSSNIDDVDLFPFVQPWLYVNIWHITIVMVNDKMNKIRIWELTICNIKKNMFILKWYVIRLKKKKIYKN